MLSPSCSANLTNSNLIATADPPILGIAFLLRQGVNDQSDQVLTISPVHTTFTGEEAVRVDARRWGLCGSTLWRAMSMPYFSCRSDYVSLRAEQRVPGLP